MPTFIRISSLGPESYQISNVQSFSSPRWKFICANFTDDCGNNQWVYQGVFE